MRIAPVLLSLFAIWAFEIAGVSGPSAWCAPRPPARQRVIEARPGQRAFISEELRSEIHRLSSESNSTQLRLSAPRRVQMGVPFDVDLWLSRPRALSVGVETGVTTAFAAPSGVVSYNPEQVDLTPNRPQRLRVVVNKSDSGLAMLEVATSAGATTTTVVDAGFKGLIRAKLGDVLESNTAHVVTLEFVDQAGRPLSLDAPVVATVRASKATLRMTPADSWSEDLTMLVPAGSRSLPAFELRPRSSVATEGVLRVQVALTEDYVLADASFHFGIVPWGWAQLAFSILGGILYGTYALLKQRPKRKRRQSITVIASAGLAGVVAYLLATWNILGIKVDSSSLRAFVFLGFLFAYLGVDAVLRAVTEKPDLVALKPVEKDAK